MGNRMLGDWVSELRRILIRGGNGEGVEQSVLPRVHRATCVLY